jgi:general secretion pathway protein D
MRPKFLAAAALAGALALTAGCIRSNRDYNLGRKAELLQDYDTALVHYERALRTDPGNAEYKLKVARLRFEAGQSHVEQGQRLMARGDLTDVERALGQFQRAMDIDPSSAIANDLARKAVAKIAELKGAGKPPAPKPDMLSQLQSMPPELKPISTEPINLKMTNDARIVYETIAKLAGLTVIFDPDFSSRRISVELPNVSLQQALDAVSLESKSFWKPVTPGIIFVSPDNAQKRREYEDQVVKTFYLANSLTPQDLTEVVGGLRQLLALRQIQQINSQNAIVVRDTPDKIAVADKIIHDIDKQRAEVMLQVSVLEVNMNRARDLGIQPGSSATLTFTPRSELQPGTTSSTSTTGTTGTSTSVPQVTLNNLKRLSSADYSLTLPGAAVQALLTDSTTKIIQNPQMLVTDGEVAHLKIGDRVPIATGSFQAGVGVGVGAAGAGLVNPLVNTQFQYQDVGVNIDVTPRVHPDEDVSLKLTIEVSSVTSFQNIGGIQQPVISQRKIEHQIRLRDGEVSVLGGLVQHTTTKSTAGWPGLSKVPFLRYFFSNEHTEEKDDEVLIVLTPHVVRMPDISSEDMRALFTGTAQNVEVLQKTAPAPSAAAPAAPSGTAAAPGQAAPAPAATAPAGLLRFQPATVSVQPGQTTTIALTVENATDLFSIPMILHFDPKVISIEDVRNGGFLAGGTEAIAIFHRTDPVKGDVIMSATRQPKTAGVSGSGTLVGIVVKGLAAGTSLLTIEQVSARNSQQKPLTFQTQPATVHVGPKP